MEMVSHTDSNTVYHYHTVLSKMTVPTTQGSCGPSAVVPHTQWVLSHGACDLLPNTVPCLPHEHSFLWLIVVFSVGLVA